MITNCRSMFVNASHCLCQESIATFLSGQSVQIGDEPLEKVQSYKYLGVVINSNLTWSP